MRSWLLHHVVSNLPHSPPRRGTQTGDVPSRPPAHTTRNGIFAALSALLLTTCGNVYVDSSGSGTGNDTATSSAAVDVDAFCTNVGNTAAGFGCATSVSVEGFIAMCLSSYMTAYGCEAEVTSYYICQMAHLSSGTCLNAGECAAQADAWAACSASGADPTCELNGCGADTSDCSCDGWCNGAALQADCKATPDGAECVCLVDGQQAGTCTSDQFTCELFHGCCAQYFPL